MACGRAQRAPTSSPQSTELTTELPRPGTPGRGLREQPEWNRRASVLRRAVVFPSKPTDSMYELCVTPFTLRESPRTAPATRSPSLPPARSLSVLICVHPWLIFPVFVFAVHPWLNSHPLHMLTRTRGHRLDVDPRFSDDVPPGLNHTAWTPQSGTRRRYSHQDHYYAAKKLDRLDVRHRLVP